MHEREKGEDLVRYLGWGDKEKVSKRQVMRKRQTEM